MTDSWPSSKAYYKPWNALTDSLVTRPTQTPSPSLGNHQKRQVGAVATQPGKKSPQRCPQCNQEHLLHRCDQFLALKTKERWASVKKWNICFNCFFGTHRVSECTSKFSCKTCKKKHHSLLHYENKTANALGLYDSDSGDEDSDHIGGAATITTPADPTAKVTNTDKADSPTHGESVIPTNPDIQVDFQALPARASGVYMSTILIPIKKPDGTTVSIRAMLDTGAECNVLSAEAANRINASIQPTTTRIFGVGGANGPSVLGKTSLNVNAGPDDATFTVNAFVMQNVVRALPRNPLPRNLLQQFSHYKLADPHFSTATTIDMLIGIENYHDFVCQKRVKVANMWLQETILGWTVSGKPFKRSPTPGVKAFTCFLTTYARESDVLLPSQLHDSACADLRQFERFWTQEDPPQPTKPHLTTEETDCQAHFDETTTRQADGRVVVALPFKPNTRPLGHSKAQALRRLTSVWDKLQRDPDYKQLYVDFIAEFRQMGHLEVVPPDEIDIPDSQCFYLPHHGVVKSTSTTTKLRVVFDGSAKSSSGISLNEKLMIGPRIQEDIFSILVSFRSYLVGLTADVAKMYRQVALHITDKDFHRILWKDPDTGELITLRMTRVTYRCYQLVVPFNLRSLQIATTATTIPATIEALKRGFYVDDYLGGADSTQAAIALRADLTQALATVQMPIRKWCTNSPDVAASIPPEDRETATVVVAEGETGVRTLGVGWNMQKDVFAFIVPDAIKAKLSPEPGKPMTRRKLLSNIATVFDPLGWLGPTTITHENPLPEDMGTYVFLG